MNTSRRAKIVCTLGPASCTDEILTAMISAGMDVARLNFSHGDHAGHAEQIARVRRVAQKLGKAVPVLQDLQGPKIRVGDLCSAAAVELQDGAEFIITARPVEGNAREVSTTYADLPHDVHPGDRLLLDDGLLELQVEAVAGPDVHTRVVHGGRLKPHKGINVPGAALSVPSLTDKDRSDLEFGVTQGVDYVALSFVRRAADLTQIRHLLAEMGPAAASLPVIAKLEKPAALDDLDAILEQAEGVMVARGDLGVELSPQQVPIAQKRIITAANRAGKLVITATQMLESMTVQPRPTRAEVSDVANAIFDGTDAVMLSAETATGAYPVEAVSMMAAIIQEAEANSQWSHCAELMREGAGDDAVALAQATRELAQDRDVAAIAVFTRSGRTARLISKTRPQVPILAFTPEPAVYPRLALLWGVTPYLITPARTVEEMIERVESVLLRETALKAGDQVVLVGGLPASRLVPPNFIMLHTVGRFA